MGRQGGCNPISCAVGIVILMAAIVVLTLVTLIAVAIGFLIYVVLSWLFIPQPRLFGAWKMSRWTSGYEHLLFQLEQRTEIDFNTTPLRLLHGSLIISLTPLVFFGIIFSAYNPDFLWIMPAVGLLTGFLTAASLSRVPNWFSGATSTPVSHDIPSDKFLLEEDNW